MKRFFVALLIMIVSLAVFVPVSAQDEAPEGTWFGTWPYVLPPEHNFNSFATGGLNSNLGTVYKTFVELNPAYYVWATGEYRGLLADSWGFTDDGAAYEMTLKEATWSDGSAITSADVVATYHIGEILGWSQFNYIDSVEAIDDLTTRFNFIDGEPSLLAERLILKEYISPASVYGDLAAEGEALINEGLNEEDDAWLDLRAAIQEFRPEELIVSGPYTYTLDDVGDAFMTLSWQPNSLYSDSVNFGELRLWAGETEATTPLVLSGDLAHSTNVYPPSSQQAFDEAGIRLMDLPRGYGPSVLFNHDVYPWNVKEVRQAAALVIQRDENAFLTNGPGARGVEYMAGLADGSVPVYLTDDAIEQLDRYEFDTERAAEVLESAGFSRNDDGIWADADGNTVSGEYKFPQEFADFSGAAQNATDQMNEFGFDITLRAVPWQQCAEDIRNGDFDLSVWSWSSPNPFAASQFFGPIQRFNYVGLQDGQVGMNFPMEFEWEGEEVNLDEMIDNTSAGIDIEAQRAVASDVALIINELMPYIPLNTLRSIEPFNENLISADPPLEDGDVLLGNPSGADHFIIYYILNGRLGPA